MILTLPEPGARPDAHLDPVGFDGGEGSGCEREHLGVVVEGEDAVPLPYEIVHDGDGVDCGEESEGGFGDGIPVEEDGGGGGGQVGHGGGVIGDRAD